MNEKLLATVLAVSVFAVPAAVVGLKHTFVDQPEHVQPEPIPAPVIYPNETSVLVRKKVVEVGELVTIKEGGDAVDWLFIPEIEDYYLLDKPGHCVLSFRSPGQYLAIASVVNGGGVKTQKWEITVNSGFVANEWARRFADWGLRPGEGLADFAAVFRETAAELKSAINENLLLTPEEILARLSERAKRLPANQWSNLRGHLIPVFKELEAEGELLSVADFARVFEDIAEALDPQ